jgi:hypothetical protein
LDNRLVLRIGLRGSCEEEGFEIIVEKDKFPINIDGLVVIKPRIVLPISTILHERKQRTNLHPSEEEPLLRGLFLFVTSDIKTKIKVASGCTVDDINHRSCEALNCIVLIPNPS